MSVKAAAVDQWTMFWGEKLIVTFFNRRALAGYIKNSDPQGDRSLRYSVNFFKFQVLLPSRNWARCAYGCPVK
jgi:hypothetical protein